MNIPKYIESFRNEITRKGYRKNSVDSYVACVGVFLQHFDGIVTEPMRINEAQIKDYLRSFKSDNTQRANHSAIKCFYKYVLNQPNKFRYIEYCRKEKRLPIVLSVDEIQRMFNACENLKHRVILSLLYSCGLRVSELLNLKWSNIDRSRMVINIIGGKGNKDRQVMLSEQLIPLLANYWREYRSVEYVLNGQGGSSQYSQRSVGEVVKQLATKAGIDNKRVYTHLIRHCSFTHMVESGVDVNIIQRIAGHSSVKTTNIYLHTSHNLISKTYSPLQSIQL